MNTQRTTKGINIFVETGYKGRYLSKQGHLYIFVYNITITNLGENLVQLMGRHWYIYDTGEGPSEVSGDGVVGQQPIIAPGQSYTYQSGCHLRASIGLMKGHYKMKNVDTGGFFRVAVPNMQFFATPRLN